MQEKVRKYVHWSAHCSLYSGKTRAYLIKKGLDFVEINPGHAHYTEILLPQIGFFSLPVLETPHGEVIQDTTAIIKFLEQKHPEPTMQPADQSVCALAWLIHSYGTEGLFKAAQHFRWNFRDENFEFIINEFDRGLVPPAIRGTPAGRARAEEYAEAKTNALARIGVTRNTIPAIEKSTEKLFECLEQHFRSYPYILGGRPSVADCGLMTALHAHLGRDPYPSRIMKETAPALYRWTETMNRPGIFDAELWDVEPEFFEVETLPDTLLCFLELLCADFGPELVATAGAYADWLAATPERPTGSLVSINNGKQLRQSLGMITHIQQGVEISREAWPDILLMHQDFVEIVDSMSDPVQKNFASIMKGIGGDDFLTVELPRPIERAPYSILLS